MSKYENLPGIEVQIADGGLILPEDSTTQSMLIIAPALENGAPKEPVLVRQSSDLTAYGFGDFTNSSNQVNPIAAAWKAAFEGGNRRIFLMALEDKDENGAALTDAQIFANLQGSLFGILADFPVDHIVVTGVTADVEANLAGAAVELSENGEGETHEYQVVGTTKLGANVAIEAGTNDSIGITIDSASVTLTLDAQTFTSAEDFVAAINSELKSDPATAVITASLNGEGMLVLSDLFSNGTFSVQGADVTTAPLGLALGTTAAPEVAAATEVHTGNYAALVGEFANMQTLNLNACIGYIGTSSPATNTLTDVKAHVEDLLTLRNEYSAYVSVVAGPDLGYLIPNKADLYYMNGVVTYAALVSTLRPESAPTNKRVYGVAGVRNTLSLRQLNQLTGNKYVTFRLKGNQVVVTDGITTAPDYMSGGVMRSSDYTRLSTLRITQAASELIRDICDPFIGEPNRMPQYNSLTASIKAGLEAMKNQGALNDYRFTIVATGTVLNEAVVTLELVPAFEMRKVTVNVSLRPQFLQG